MKLLAYSDEYYDKILHYVQDVWSHKSKEYLDYRLFEFPEQPADNKCNIIVVNDNDEVIGINMFFPTSAKIGSNEEKVYWSHDTFVSPKYRGDIGMMLILQIREMDNVLGNGLTDINNKIQRTIKSRFVSNGYTYVFIAYRAMLTMPLRIFASRKTDGFCSGIPVQVTVNGYTFRRIHDTKEIKIPNNGYWFGDAVDVDLIRDRHFISTRFLRNKLRKYYLYALCDNDESSYFVIRIGKVKSFHAIIIVDFRFGLNHKDGFATIFLAVKKIAAKLGILLVKIYTNYEIKQRLALRGKMSPIIFNTKYKRNEEISIIVTGADSDSDFLI